MSYEEPKLFPNRITPADPVVFDANACTGCNICVEVCVMDLLVANPEKGKPPVIVYPDECYYDGLCVCNCPVWQKGAIKLNHPLNQRVRWKRKDTGEHYRLGMPDPPPPNNKPPVGGWDAKSNKKE